MSEAKKSVSTLDMEKVSAVLLDVAGTTTAISFVKETLYPYITKNAEEFLKENWENEDVKKAIEKFEEKDLDVTKATEAVKSLTEKDDSNEGLKAIQGLLLKKGYESGELKGHVFEDVPKFFNSWSENKKIAIFSSGSVESQQLLFKNSSEGDLSSQIKKFFDLSVGSKTDSETYKKIAKELEVSPVDVLFLTDDLKEADAAKAAEINVVVVEREGNTPMPEESKANYTVVKSFAEISVEKLKRKIVADEASVEEPPSKMAKIEVTEPTVEKTEEETKTEEKKEVETAVEAMEVDEEPSVPEKVEETPSEEKPETKKETVEEKKEETKPEEPKTEDKPEAMEVDAKITTESKTENKEETQEKPETTTNNTETEKETQTKNAATNECETQTTISLAAVEELPIKKVEDILKSTEQETEKKEEEKTETPKTEEEKTETPKKEETVERKEEILETKEVKEDTKEVIEAEEKKEEVKKDETEVKEDKTVVEKEVTKPEIKENGTEVKKDEPEVKENGTEEKKEPEVKENGTEVKEDKPEVKENGTEVKEDVKTEEKVEEEKKENGEVKTNGDSCKNGDVVEKEEEKKENGVEDKKEKENESKLANGKDSEVPNGEAAEATNGTSVEAKEEEIKVKKIGEHAETAPVSVEA